MALRRLVDLKDVLCGAKDPTKTPPKTSVFLCENDRSVFQESIFFKIVDVRKKETVEWPPKKQKNFVKQTCWKLET